MMHKGIGLLPRWLHVVCTCLALSLVPAKADISPSCVASLVHDVGSYCTTNNSSSVTAAVNSFVVCGQLGRNTTLKTISILAPDPLNPSIIGLADLYQKISGYSITFTFRPITEVSVAIKFALNNNLTQLYDGWILQPSSLSAIAAYNALLPLESLVVADTGLDWPDLHPFLLKVSGAYNGHLVGLPLSSEAAVLYYRHDVFAALNVTVPNTWHEMLALAQYLNGTDFSGDGVGDYALCFQVLDHCVEDGVLLGQILAPLTQYQGTLSGWLFDPDNLNSFASGPAMAHALELYRAFLPYVWPDGFCTETNYRLQQGQCAMTIKWSEGFKKSELNYTDNVSFIHGKLGTAMLPGHAYIFDRRTGVRTTCNATLCPYADRVVNATTGEEEWVNRSPYFGFGSFGGSINALADPDYHPAIYNFFSFLASSAVSSQVALTPTISAGPIRLSLMLPSALPLWVSAGYDANDTAAFLAIWAATLSHPNIALDLRLLGSESYDALLASLAHNVTVGALSVPQLLAAANSTSRAILAASGSTAVVLFSYRASMSLASLSPSPPSPPQQGYDEVSSGLSAGQLAAAIAAPVATTLLILVVVAVVLTQWKSSSWSRVLRKRSTVPGAGLDTTLLVTDIENSTVLWEALSEDTMNRVMKLHHDLFRSMLDEHDGYESQTEGDSFILSFHLPQNALEFAMAVQDALLHCPWPPELLEMDGCSPMWAVQSTALKSSQTATDVLSGGAPRHESVIIKSWRRLRGRSGVLTDSGSADARSDSTIDAMHRSQRMAATPSTVRSQRGNSRQLSREMSAAESLWDALDCNDHSNQLASCDFGSMVMPHGNGGLLLPQLMHKGSMILAAGTAKEQLQRAWREVGPPVSCESNIELHLDSPPPVILSSSLKSDAEQQQQLQRRVLVFRGLRVRMGMSSGLEGDDVELNKTTSRTQYTGRQATVARSVSDAARGGMILLSEATFIRLSPESLRDHCLIMNMGEHLLQNEQVPPTVLYMAFSDQLMQRFAFLGSPRTRKQLQAGLDDAPMGQVAIVFMNVVGTSILLSWNKDIMTSALQTYHHHASMQLQQHKGYLVELSEGLCLAAFLRSTDAVRWACSVVHQLKQADWSEQLLAHEMCEEMSMGVMEHQQGPLLAPDPSDRSYHDRSQNDGSVGGGGGVSGGGNPTRGASHPGERPPLLSGSQVLDSRAVLTGPLPAQPAAERVAGVWHAVSLVRTSMGGSPSAAAAANAVRNKVVLLRGLRLKVGVDLGQVKAVLNCVTGRMAYRGRAMNRAARIASIAATGQVVCSAPAWDGVEAVMNHGLVASPMGEHALKGVAELVHLYNCQLDTSSVLQLPPTALDSFRNSPPSSFVRLTSCLEVPRHQRDQRDSPDPLGLVTSLSGGMGRGAVAPASGSAGGGRSSSPPPLMTTSLSNGSGNCGPRSTPTPSLGTSGAARASPLSLSGSRASPPPSLLYV